MSAAAPPPQRLQVRLSILSRGFSELAAFDPVTVSSDALRELDAQTLKSCRILAAAVAISNPFPLNERRRGRRQIKGLAERGGFEPPEELPPHVISSHADSASLASLQS